MQTNSLLTLLAAGLLMAAPAHAQWYLGAGIGATDARLNEGAQSAQQLAANGFSGVGTSLDKRDTGGRVYGGYQIRPWLAVELGYADLGKYRIASNAVAGAAGAGTLDTDLKISGAEVSVVGRYPLNEQLSLFGRVGAFAAEAESTVASSGTIVLLQDSGVRYKKRETVATFGLGGEYRIAPKVWLRGDWSRFEKVKTFDVLGAERDTSVDLYTVGIVYKF